MTIWSRIRDGVVELSWTGLFGLPDPGTAVEPGRPDGQKQVGFTIAVIALGAKMAMADNEVTEDEVRAFHEVFQAPPEERSNVEFFFNLARRSTTGAETYARQAARLLAGNKPVLEDLLGALFHIARADGKFTADEDAYLNRVARAFGFDDPEYQRIRALHVGDVQTPGDLEDPWLILGLPRGTDAAHIRVRWRELVRDNHPDLAIAQGLPAEFISIATAKLARINAAYDALAGRN